MSSEDLPILYLMRQMHMDGTSVTLDRKEVPMGYPLLDEEADLWMSVIAFRFGVDTAQLYYARYHPVNQDGSCGEDA